MDMKRRIKLTKSDLQNIIKESVKRVFKEGGHLYHKDDDGLAMRRAIYKRYLVWALDECP